MERKATDEVCVSYRSDMCSRLENTCFYSYNLLDVCLLMKMTKLTTAAFTTERGDPKYVLVSSLK